MSAARAKFAPASGHDFALRKDLPARLKHSAASSNLPVLSDFSKMPSTGGHVPTVTVAPASASALQIAQP